MSEQSKAPDVIWAMHPSIGEYLDQPPVHEEDKRFLTEYVSRDHCNALVAAARAEGYAKALEAVSDEWSMAVQGDLEHGVQTLNVNAANAFAKNYPNLSSFGDWLDGQIGRGE